MAGIRKGASVKINAQCDLLVEFAPLASKTGPRHWIPLLVFGAGESDYPGIILGLPALDVPPFGLGWRLTDRCHVFDALSVMLPREEIRFCSSDGTVASLGPQTGYKVVGYALLSSAEVVLAPGDLGVLQVQWDVLQPPFAETSGNTPTC